MYSWISSITCTIKRAFSLIDESWIKRIMREAVLACVYIEDTPWAIKDQTLAIARTTRRDCLLLLLVLLWGNISYLVVIKWWTEPSVSKWISSLSSTRHQLWKSCRHQIMMDFDFFLLFCFQSSRRLAENLEINVLLSPSSIFHILLAECLPIVWWLNRFTELLNIILFIEFSLFVWRGSWVD